MEENQNGMVCGSEFLRQKKDDELMHDGIKGMHWGIRRYQYEDGSLTPAGKERYAKMAADRKNDTSKKSSETSIIRPSDVAANALINGAVGYTEVEKARYKYLRKKLADTLVADLQDDDVISYRYTDQNGHKVEEISTVWGFLKTPSLNPAKDGTEPNVEIISISNGDKKKYSNGELTVEEKLLLGSVTSEVKAKKVSELSEEGKKKFFDAVKKKNTVKIINPDK